MITKLNIMNISIEIIIFLLFLFGGSGLLLTFRSMKARLGDSIYLLFSSYGGAIFGLFAFITIFLRFSGNIELSVFFQKIVPIPLLVTYLSGYLYHEGFISVSPPPKRLVPVIVVFSGLFLFNILVIADILTYNQLDLIAAEFVFTAAYGTAIHLYLLTIYKKLLSFADIKDVRIDQKSVQGAAVSYFVLCLAFLLEWIGVYESFSIPQYILLGISAVTLSLGIGILMLNRAKWGQVLFYIPIPLHNILIYNQCGILIYSKRVNVKVDENVLKQDEVLISGALSAFSIFFKEVLGSNERFTEIKTSNTIFSFSDLPRNAGTLVVISSGTNYFIKRSLDRFSAGITEYISNLFQSGTKLDEIEKICDELAIKAFPYLEISNQQQKIVSKEASE
jgi:hypothetical protein